jgi:hypothetical protein
MNHLLNISRFVYVVYDHCFDTRIVYRLVSIMVFTRQVQRNDKTKKSRPGTQPTREIRWKSGNPSFDFHSSS